MNRKLVEFLKQWNGKQTGLLSSIYHENVHNPKFWEELLEIYLNYPDLENATTWLFKHQLDTKRELEVSIVNQLLLRANNVMHWEAQLHLLQIIPSVTLDSTVLESVEQLIRKGLESKNKFVRAWSYTGMYELSFHWPTLKNELLFLCNKGIETESASVKVRIKKVLQKLED